MIRNPFSRETSYKITWGLLCLLAGVIVAGSRYEMMNPISQKIADAPDNATDFVPAGVARCARLHAELVHGDSDRLGFAGDVDRTCRDAVSFGDLPPSCRTYAGRVAQLGRRRVNEGPLGSFEYRLMELTEEALQDCAADN